MNKVILMGRLVEKPEVKYSKSAEPVAFTNIRIAVNRKIIKDNKQEADFINCVAFGKKAEFLAKYFDKGQKIAITGEFRTDSYQDENGLKRTSIKVLIDDIEFVEKKKEEENTQVNDKEYEENDYELGDEDLPF